MPVVSFKRAKIGMKVYCASNPDPVEIMAFSAGFRVQLQVIPTTEGRQYVVWPRFWLDDHEFDAAGYVTWKELEDLRLEE